MRHLPGNKISYTKRYWKQVEQGLIPVNTNICFLHTWCSFGFIYSHRQLSFFHIWSELHFIMSNSHSHVHDKCFFNVFDYFLPVSALILFRKGFFGAPQGWRGARRSTPSLKFVTHILPRWKVAQLYLTRRRSKKYMNHVTHSLGYAPWAMLLGICIFHRKSASFVLSSNTDINCSLIHKFNLF